MLPGRSSWHQNGLTTRPGEYWCNKDISIKDLLSTIQKYTGFAGEIRRDTSKPDGQPRRCLVTSRAKEEFGFEAKVSFDEGLKQTIEWYMNRLKKKENQVIRVVPE